MIETETLWFIWVIVGMIVGLVLHVVLPGRYRFIFDLTAGAFGGLLGGLLTALAGAVGAEHFGLLSTVIAGGGAGAAWGLLHWSRLSYKQTATRQP